MLLTTGWANQLTGKTLICERFAQNNRTTGSTSVCDRDQIFSTGSLMIICQVNVTKVQPSPAVPLPREGNSSQHMMFKKLIISVSFLSL